MVTIEEHTNDLIFCFSRQIIGFDRRFLRTSVSSLLSLMASLLSLFLLLVFSCSFSSYFAEIGRKELRNNVNKESFIQLGRPIRSSFINPSQVIPVSWQPRVFLYRNFLSIEECDHLISLAQATEEKALGNNDDSGRALINRLLKSSETHLDMEDEIVTRIEERLAAWTFIPRENSEPLHVMHYGYEKAGQQFDYYGNSSALALSKPLMATVVLYLSNASLGGQILFPLAEINDKPWSDCTETSNDIKPIKGNAILFFTVRPNASPDGSSSHARCPVIEGEMWCATKNFHVKATNEVQVSVDSDQSDGSDCVDQDENCAEWAAFGECQRNPVFMIGSPDYFGTCRKSCNACY